MKNYTPTERQQTDLNNNLSYHAPKEDQVPRYEHLRKMGKDFAQAVLVYTPPSREQSLALTKIEEAVMWANSAIARIEK